MCKMCDGYPGLYDVKCLDCCVRLVMSTKPDKQLAAAMLQSIEMFPGAPKRSEILSKIKDLKRKKV